MNEPNLKIHAKFVDSTKYLTPNKVATMLEVAPHTVLRLIGTGQLKALDVGTAHKPRWKIDRKDFQEFLASRVNVVKPVIGVRGGLNVPNSSHRILGGIR